MNEPEIFKTEQQNLNRFITKRLRTLTGDELHTEDSIKRSTSCILPLPHGSASLASLEDLSPAAPDIGTLSKRISSRALSSAEDDASSKGFWFPAIMSVILGIASVVPYNMVIASDTGSPLFISFVTHIFFVCINIEHLGALLSGNIAIPLYWHAAFVALGFLFNMLKSDAFARLPCALCMLLLNLQMLIGMVVQFVALGKRYSLMQLCGCGLVTGGVAIAASAKAQSNADTASVPTGDMVVGVSEMVGSLLAITIMNLLIKVAFKVHGEAIGEQLFIQHLFGLPLFLIGNQWQQIGPRAVEWLGSRDWWKICLLLVNMALTFGDRKLSGQVNGRAPNVILVPLLETLKKFMSMLLSALLAAPPLPPLAFWAGAMLLGLGMLQYLSASDVPAEKKDD
jgi:hypothetical protein